MTKPTIAALAARWFQEVWNDRNDATLKELGHRDLVGHVEDYELRGHDGVKQARRELYEAFPDFQLHIEAVISQGDNVAARWLITGTHTANGFTVPATGTRIAERGLTWLRFKDGRMVEGWDSWNQGGLLAKLRAAHEAKR